MRRGRDRLLLGLGAAAIALLPWIGYLAASLPDRFAARQWRAAWVGFDLALTGCLATTAWLGVRRHRAAPPMLIATAVLLLCDAWFDVMLDWGGTSWTDGWTSLGLAVCVEIPLAILLLRRSRLLLASAVPTRELDRDDVVEVFNHPVRREIMNVVGRHGATSDSIARSLGMSAAEVDEHLRLLAARRFVEPVADGSGVPRWRWAPNDLRWPRSENLRDAGTRAAFQTLARQRAVDEVALLTRACAEWQFPDPWRKASRGNAYLTDAELEAFGEEYLDLLGRYGHRHSPAPGARQVAVRWYAFPPPRPVGVPAGSPVDAEHRLVRSRPDALMPRR